MRHVLMIAFFGLATVAMTGSEAQAQSWGRSIGRSYGNVGSFSRGVIRYNTGSYNRGFNNNFYRSGYRNPYQSIPRPNPYYGGGYGGYGYRGFGGGSSCRRW